MKDKKNNKKEFSTKNRLLKMSEISIWIDTYDDIFSDFDPRPYQDRILSDDFLQESKRVSKENKFGLFELKILIPSKLRDQKSEKIIRIRLHQYFNYTYEKIKNDIKRIRLRGVLLALFAGVLTTIATKLSINPPDNFFIHFLRVILEPAGWFTIWTGLENIFIDPQEKKSDLTFYKKMANCKIIFISY
jgi:hypothetical protein